jgi:hypothetical protein
VSYIKCKYNDNAHFDSLQLSNDVIVTEIKNEFDGQISSSLITDTYLSELLNECTITPMRECIPPSVPTFNKKYYAIKQEFKKCIVLNNLIQGEL